MQKCSHIHSKANQFEDDSDVPLPYHASDNNTVYSVIRMQQHYRPDIMLSDSRLQSTHLQPIRRHAPVWQCWATHCQPLLLALQQQGGGAVLVMVSDIPCISTCIEQSLQGRTSIKGEVKDSVELHRTSWL